MLQDKLAISYNDSSPLENYHVASAWQEMQDTSGTFYEVRDGPHVNGLNEQPQTGLHVTTEEYPQIAMHELPGMHCRVSWSAAVFFANISASQHPSWLR